jgi:hypothetical protein
VAFATVGAFTAGAFLGAGFGFAAFYYKEASVLECLGEVF